MITQQRENWNPWIGTGISFLWWRDFFFFIVTTNQSTASFQNDTILQKLCKLRWFRLSSWFSTFIRSQPRVDIKHWAQTVKMSLHNVKLRLLVTVGDRDSLASGRLSHPDGKVICSHLFFLKNFHLVIQKFFRSLLESRFKVGHGRGSRVLLVHGCTCVLVCASRWGDGWARRSQWQRPCSERSLSGC